MPRQPDMPCAKCGTMMWRGTGTLPEGLATCRPCRRAANPWAAQQREEAKLRPKFKPELRFCISCGVEYLAKRNTQKYCRIECRPVRFHVRSADRPTSAERGYGAAHQRLRAEWDVFVQSGQASCCLCGGWIEPGSPWDLDHTPDREGYRGAAHAHCNRRDGASRGGARSGGWEGEEREVQCATCSTMFVTKYKRHTYCSRECRPKRKARPPREPRQPNACTHCGQSTMRPKYCSDACSYAAFKVSARNAYRATAGIPLDAPLYSRTG